MPALSLIEFRIASGVLASPGYGIYRPSARTWFDFTSTTTPIFSATPTTVATALTKGPYPGDVEEWHPTADLSGTLVNQFPAEAYEYKLFDLSSTPVLAVASSPIAVTIAGGTDQPAQGTVALTSQDKADIAAAIGGGIAAAIFAQTVGGGTFAQAIEAIAAAAAWSRTQSSDGTTTTINAFMSTATRLTSTNSTTGRTVTYVP